MHNNNTSNKTTTKPKKKEQKKETYYYVGYLEISKIKFKRGFVDINSRDNVVSKNITIISNLF